MTDSLAIKLFEADGGVAVEWHAQDECVRLFYRKKALEGGRGSTPAGENLSVQALPTQRAARVVTP